MRKKFLKFTFPIGPVYLNCGYNNSNFANNSINDCNVHVIVFSISGSISFVENNKTIYLNENQWYIKSPKLNETFKISSCSGECFYIEFVNLSAYNDKLLKSNLISFPHCGNFSNHLLIPLIRELYSVEKTNQNNKLTLQKQFLTILETILTTYNNLDNQAKKIDDIMLHIKNNYTKNISLDDLSFKFNYTKSHIVNLVKSHYNMTPIQYVQFLRVEEAKKLLINTDLHLLHISLDLGYSDVSLFFRAFKKHTGVSPSIWRKINKPETCKELTL